jgi:N-acetyl-gamma-glutamyl-phosphate reductase
MSINVVLIGGRGYTGSELLPLLQHHPECDVVAVSSSSANGELVKNHIEGMADCGLRFSDIRAENLPDFPADLYVLALANGRAEEYVAAIDAVFPAAVIIDLSADYRFDPGWVYGQPERFSAQIQGAMRIANPGCYATGAQLALAPLSGQWVSSPVVFGISGFSGAGKTPSRKNDPDVLRDNLLPYALNDHVHQQEVSHWINSEVRFLPHVASFFRGISLSLALELDRPASEDQLYRHYLSFYSDCPLIRVQKEIPEVVQVRAGHGVIMGGFSVSMNNPANVSMVCVLDNLLKGAATQVIQNLNLAFNLPPLTGLGQDDQAKSGDQT